MSETIRTALKSESIESINTEKLEIPEIPVDIYPREANDLYNWCQEDREDLINAGIDWTIVEDIPVRVASLLEAESRWFSEKFINAKSLNEWKILSKQGYEIRNVILHAMAYAYRHEPDLMAELSVLKNGTKSTDLIQNLKDIAIFGKENSEHLMHINYDINLLNEATEFSAKLASILAEGERGEYSSETKRARNKAYILLKEAVDEVRACGQYVFWRNAERLRGYKSIHNSNSRSN